MRLELGRTIQRRKKTEVVEAALLEREHAAAPARAPAPLGDHLLEVGAELVGVRQRLVDVVVAEHLASQLHALLVKLALSHRVCPPSPARTVYTMRSISAIVRSARPRARGARVPPDGPTVCSRCPR